MTNESHFKSQYDSQSRGYSTTKAQDKRQYTLQSNGAKYMSTNSVPTSGTHKDYIKNMLIQKFSKKYGNDAQTI
jgi:hypothetical protein